MYATRFTDIFRARECIPIAREVLTRFFTRGEEAKNDNAILLLLFAYQNTRHSRIDRRRVAEI